MCIDTHDNNSFFDLAFLFFYYFFFDLAFLLAILYCLYFSGLYGIYYEELVHVIMEPDKIHYLPSTSWRHRESMA